MAKLNGAGNYLKNLMSQYDKYRTAREEKRENFRTGVDNAISGAIDRMPDNIQNGINKAGSYIKNLTGYGSVGDYLGDVDDYIRRLTLGGAATADQLYERLKQYYDSIREGGGVQYSNPEVPKQSGEASADRYYYTNENKESNLAQTERVAYMDRLGAAPSIGGGLNFSESTGEDQGQEGSAQTSGTNTDTGSTKTPVVVNKSQYEPKQGIVDYETFIKNQQESVIEKYKSDVNYAEKNRDYSYQLADDSYRVAAREADSNFKMNQPGYGRTAEELVASGLNGSGYSEYLGGKAYEARANELADARSQASAMKYAANQEYNEAIKEAENNKFTNETNLESARIEYAQQLAAGFKDRYEEVIANIQNGYYNASTAESILKRYTENGVISDEVRAGLAEAESQYLQTNKTSVVSSVIEFLAGQSETSSVTENQMRMLLIEGTKGNITETEIEAILDGCFKDGGRFDPDAAIQLKDKITPDKNNEGNATDNVDGSMGQSNTNGNGGVTIEGNEGQTDTSGGNSEDKLKWYEIMLGALAAPFIGIGQLFSPKDKNSQAGEGFKDEVDGNIEQTGIRPTYNDTISMFKSAMNQHAEKALGSGEDYAALINEMEAYSRDGMINPAAAGAIVEMTKGLVVSTGSFDTNKGIRKQFQDGDNFTVNIGEKSYRVDSDGEAGDDVKAAAADLNDGTLFGYGSELYLKTDDGAIKITGRSVFGKKDYKELWKAVYGEALDQLASKAPTNPEALEQLNNANVGAANLYHSYIADKLGAFTDNTKTNQGKDTTPQPGKNSKPITFEGNIALGKMIDAFKKLFNKENNDRNVGGGSFSGGDGNTGLEGFDPFGNSAIPGGTVGGTGASGAGGENTDWFSRIELDASFKNGDGTINNQKLMAYIPEADTDGDGRISNEEAGVFVSKLDTDRDGYISAYDISSYRAIDKVKITDAKYEGEKGGFLSLTRDGSVPTGSNFENGANITISYKGKDYFVDVAKQLDTKTEAYQACSSGKIAAGTIFIDSQGQVCLSRGKGKTPYLLSERGGVSFHKKDFEELKAALSLNDAGKETVRGDAVFASDGLLNKNLQKGDNFTVEVGGKTYRVESGGEVSSDHPVVEAASEVFDGEVFSWGDQAYLKKGGRIYEIDTRFLSPKQEEKLVEAIGENGVEDDSNITYGTTSLPNIRDEDYKSGDVIKIKDGHGSNYKVKISSVRGNDWSVYNYANDGGVTEDGAFIYGDQVYVKHGDLIYELAHARGYDKLKEYLSSGFKTDAAANCSGLIINETVKLSEDNLKTTTYNNYNAIKEGQPIHLSVGDTKITVSAEDRYDKSFRAYDAYQKEKDRLKMVYQNYEMFLWNNRAYIYLDGEGVILLQDNKALINALNK